MIMDRKKDALDQNPFFHVVSLTSRQWMLTLLFGVVLVPLRLMVITLLLVTVWVPYSLVLTFFEPKITRLEKQFNIWFFWILSKSMGISATFEGMQIKLCFVNVLFKENIIKIETCLRTKIL